MHHPFCHCPPPEAGERDSADLPSQVKAGDHPTVDIEQAVRLPSICMIEGYHKLSQVDITREVSPHGITKWLESYFTRETKLSSPQLRVINKSNAPTD